MPKLRREDALLVVIDVQEKLMPVIHEAAEVERNIDRLARGTHILGVPALLTEQYVKGLGHTTSVVRKAFEQTHGYDPIEKSCFSAFGCDSFRAKLKAIGRRQILVAGIEAHVCVYQTVLDLLGDRYEVTLISDGISSRSLANKNVALNRMQQEGAKLSSTEMALFELTALSGTDEFRAISKLVK